MVVGVSVVDCYLRNRGADRVERLLNVSEGVLPFWTTWRPPKTEETGQVEDIRRNVNVRNVNTLWQLTEIREVIDTVTLVVKLHWLVTIVMIWRDHGPNDKLQVKGFRRGTQREVKRWMCNDVRLRPSLWHMKKVTHWIVLNRLFVKD